MSHLRSLTGAAHERTGLTRRELLTGAGRLRPMPCCRRCICRRGYQCEPASRRGRWAAVGVSGGIPNRTVQFGTTIAPFTDRPAPSTRRANCPDDQFVQLGAGTFNLSSSITIANHRMTLRGTVNSNGAPTTVINFTGGSVRLVGFESAGWDLSNTGQYTTVNVTGGVSRGSTTLTLASTPSSLVVGQMMFISAPSSATVTPGGGNWSDLFGRDRSRRSSVASKTGNNVTFDPQSTPVRPNIQVHWRTVGDRPG